MTRVRLPASAKINLDLRVGARRPDGYHEIRTVFQTLALHDTVIVERAVGPFALDGDPASMPLDRTNLVWRAAEALWRAAGRAGAPRGARVRVIKRVPALAGLGGGSSDAAAALVGLSRVWRIPDRLQDLRLVAEGLGADVPFFLVGGTALGLGRGEQLYPLVDRTPQIVLLAVPPFGISTADAYRWLAQDRRRPGRPIDTGPEPRNDLEASVFARHPAIRRLHAALVRAGATSARMSGSGSAVFGLFPTELAARRAAAGLAAGGMSVWLTRTRPRTPAEKRRLA